MIIAVNDPAAPQNQRDPENPEGAAPASPEAGITPRIITTKRGKSRRASAAAGTPNSTGLSPLILVPADAVDQPAETESQTETTSATTKTGLDTVTTAGEEPTAASNENVQGAGTLAESGGTRTETEQLSGPVDRTGSTETTEPAESSESTEPEEVPAATAPEEPVRVDSSQSAEASGASELGRLASAETAAHEVAQASDLAEPAAALLDADFLSDPSLANDLDLSGEPAFLQAPERVSEATEPSVEPVKPVEPAEPMEPVDSAEPLGASAPTPSTEPTAEVAPLTRQSLRAREAAREHAKDIERPERKTGRTILAWGRRSLLLLLIAVLVVAIGSTVTTKAPLGPSETELARVKTLSETTVLLEQAKLLNARPASSTLTPALKTSLNTLDAAVQALTIPGTASASPSATPTSATTPSISGFLKGLEQQAAKNLETAGRVDPGLARLLASIGAGEAIASQYLAQLGGIPQSAPSFAAPAVDAPASSCPNPSAAASDQSAQPDQQGQVNQQQALNAVELAEQKAVYAYQVAATRLGTPAAADSALKLLAAHQETLGEVRQQLSSRCQQLPAQQAGFGLSAAFLAAPNTELSSLETQLAAVYGDLIALSDGSLRKWAIGQLLNTSRQALIFAAPKAALPGMS
ncbi:DUF4439 domain-containing protein [Psychromicrobium lacuslunae]|uniref:DUF4439 domain-containing protein n=1 Tax=Psychromicrobium lacuslunae TaxID=1618207 RepID=A0A0D4BWQ7_9MICC|nr:DUF4439 domain-containing protein [Psychromicrobium lacuslunae]AJT40545.1 hypothetical protein UM93_01500 [Psychromicrobium lacuslunae]